jgi:hypothetical protein
MACGSCKAFVRYVGPGETTGECHRYAPRPQIEIKANYESSEDPNFFAIWPMVREDDCCGEYL